MNDFQSMGDDENQNSDVPSCPGPFLLIYVVIILGHNLPCLKLTTKQGPNTGRPFYACSLPRGEQCEFFQWADVPPQPGGGG